ncbi:hypothetical protein LLH00_12525 [bacterium]|nr:hypothetical protein [bacterium]
MPAMSATCFRTILLLAVCSLSPMSRACAVENQAANGCWPQPYAVNRDEAAGVLRLSTPYYTIEHDLRPGGLPYPLAGIAEAELVDSSSRSALDAAALSGEGLNLSIPGLSVLLLHVR